jgi:ribosomal protein L23
MEEKEFSCPNTAYIYTEESIDSIIDSLGFEEFFNNNKFKDQIFRAIEFNFKVKVCDINYEND